MKRGLEFWTDEDSMYLAFKSSEERDLVYNKLMENIEEVETEQSLMHYTQQWIQGEMTNYDYLLVLNYHAYRSRSDLTQYPVFPWVVKDYKSMALDLTKEDTFRDLSQPIGAINEDRLEDYKLRYNEIPEGEKYLYGTHYSAPGYVIGYLFRKHPRWMLKFQGGQYDNPNRLFKGIHLEWESWLTNPGNVKELTPEFYEPDQEDFLVNNYGLDLGIRANGERVDDIELPNWAESPRDFLEKQREALEWEYVSERLHLWIDLIFGSKQRSIKDNNLFHPLTYEGVVDLELIEDPFERFATEQQINEFGQTPRQLFRYDHPQKYSSKHIFKSLFIAADEIVTRSKLPNKISVSGEEVKEEYEVDEEQKIIEDPVQIEKKDSVEEIIPATVEKKNSDTAPINNPIEEIKEIEP
jgi:factor associated with neutral sphingomyelinase activation